jgi:hypothetical protein
MRWVAIGLIVIGLVLLVAALFADRFGFGASGSGFGWKQMIGTILGAGLCIGGAIGWWRITRAGQEEGV